MIVYYFDIKYLSYESIQNDEDDLLYMVLSDDYKKIALASLNINTDFVRVYKKLNKIQILKLMSLIIINEFKFKNH